MSIRRLCVSVLFYLMVPTGLQAASTQAAPHDPSQLCGDCLNELARCDEGRRLCEVGSYDEALTLFLGALNALENQTIDDAEILQKVDLIRARLGFIYFQKGLALRVEDRDSVNTRAAFEKALEYYEKFLNNVLRYETRYYKTQADACFRVGQIKLILNQKAEGIENYSAGMALLMQQYKKYHPNDEKKIRDLEYNGQVIRKWLLDASGSVPRSARKISAHRHRLAPVEAFGQYDRMLPPSVSRACDLHGQEDGRLFEPWDSLKGFYRCTEGCDFDVCSACMMVELGLERKP